MSDELHLYAQVKMQRDRITELEAEVARTNESLHMFRQEGGRRAKAEADLAAAQATIAAIANGDGPEFVRQFAQDALSTSPPAALDRALGEAKAEALDEAAHEFSNNDDSDLDEAYVYKFLTNSALAIREGDA